MTTFSNSLGRPTPNTVALGGSGVQASTAYSVACAGTTGTNNIQFLASLGSSNNILTSNGPSMLPSFQALSNVSGTIVQVVGGVISSGTHNPSGSTYTTTGITQTITPKSASNSILIIGWMGVLFDTLGTSPTNPSMGLQLRRNGTSIVDFGNNAVMELAYTAGDPFTSLQYRTSFSFPYYDSPATTSATTYAYYSNYTSSSGPTFSSSPIMYLIEIAS